MEERLKSTHECDADDEGEGATKRRRGGEIGRDWKCTEPGCDKDFKSVRLIHVTLDSAVHDNRIE